MKIIARDNFDRDHVSDILIAENVNENCIVGIVTFLNTQGGSYSNRFYQAVEDDYQLYDGSDLY